MTSKIKVRYSACKEEWDTYTKKQKVEMSPNRQRIEILEN